jgi:shikimate O-hydroxycinnamoyltransferase
LSTEDGISFTGFEILAGHLWRSIAKARGIDPSKDLKFGLAVDGRSRFNPPVPNGYFGQLCTLSLTTWLQCLIFTK